MYLLRSNLLNIAMLAIIPNSCYTSQQMAAKACTQANNIQNEQTRQSISGANNALSGTLGGAGLHLCYYQKASEQFQLGVEVETNFRLQESIASVGYQIDLPKADLCFRGMVDSNWTVGAVLEKKLQPLPFSFALSGTINHHKNQFRLGCGLIIG